VKRVKEDEIGDDLEQAMLPWSPEYMAGLFDAGGDVYARVSSGVTYSWLRFKLPDASLRKLMVETVGAKPAGKATIKLGGAAGERFAATIVEHMQSEGKRLMVRKFLALRAVMAAKDTDQGALTRLQERVQLATEVMVLRALARDGPETWGQAVARMEVRS
jgi:hypothetical protein